MKTATLLKDNLDGYRGHAALYKLSKPLSEYDEEDGSHSYVIVSSSSFFQDETYIFPADSDGNLLDWGSLPGSTRGTLSHAVALGNAGYTISLGGDDV